MPLQAAQGIRQRLGGRRADVGHGEHAGFNAARPHASWWSGSHQRHRQSLAFRQHVLRRLPRSARLQLPAAAVCSGCISPPHPTRCAEILAQSSPYLDTLFDLRRRFYSALCCAPHASSSICSRKHFWLHCACKLRQRFNIVDTLLRLASEWPCHERRGQCAHEAGRHDEG